ncbi:MAG: hypothetical protein MR914_10575, partial [Clostridiales bacterium]|nr:hypothetical protein [Clostridiales bacterium]
AGVAESLSKGTTAQFGGASGDVFSAICSMRIPRFTSSKPSKFAFASDEKSIRRPVTSFVRRYPGFYESSVVSAPDDFYENKGAIFHGLAVSQEHQSGQGL